jgi:hypothetical protein
MGRTSFRFLFVGTALLLAGCSSAPTFPTERLADDLQRLLAEEQLKTSVRFIDHTVAVKLEFAGSLSQVEGQVGLGPGFDEATRKVLTQIHRVLLSTDADIRFYVLLLSDPGVPGIYLTLVRYMDDVKRAQANMLDTPEMFARTIFELNMAGPEPLTIDQYVPRDIRLEEFLSWQLARRIQYTLAETLRESGLASVGRCGGEFRNGEFAFTLDVAPASEQPLDNATLEQVFETSSAVVTKVLASYQFDNFNAVRLIHPLTGRNLVLPKDRLPVPLR